MSDFGVVNFPGSVTAMGHKVHTNLRPKYATFLEGKVHTRFASMAWAVRFFVALGCLGAPTSAVFDCGFFAAEIK